MAASKPSHAVENKLVTLEPVKAGYFKVVDLPDAFPLLPASAAALLRDTTVLEMGALFHKFVGKGLTEDLVLRILEAYVPMKIRGGVALAVPAKQGGDWRPAHAQAGCRAARLRPHVQVVRRWVAGSGQAVLGLPGLGVRSIPGAFGHLRVRGHHLEGRSADAGKALTEAMGSVTEAQAANQRIQEANQAWMKNHSLSPRGTPARPKEGSLLSPGTAGRGGLATGGGHQGEVYPLHPAVARVKESVEGGGTAGGDARGGPLQGCLRPRWGPAGAPAKPGIGGGQAGELRMFGGVWKKHAHGQIPKNAGQLFSLSPEELLVVEKHPCTRNTEDIDPATHPWRSRPGGSWGAAPPGAVELLPGGHGTPPHPRTPPRQPNSPSTPADNKRQSVRWKAGKQALAGLTLGTLPGSARGHQEDDKVMLGGRSCWAGTRSKLHQAKHYPCINGHSNARGSRTDPRYCRSHMTQVYPIRSCTCRWPSNNAPSGTGVASLLGQTFSLSQAASMGAKICILTASWGERLQESLSVGEGSHPFPEDLLHGDEWWVNKVGTYGMASAQSYWDAWRPFYSESCTSSLKWTGTSCLWMTSYGCFASKGP